MRIAVLPALGALLVAMAFVAPAQAIAKPAVPMPISKADTALLKAAAPFQALSTAAFDAPFAHLRARIARAEQAGRAIRPRLAAHERPYLDVDLDNLRIALRSHDREGLARAALDCDLRLIEDMKGDSTAKEAALMSYAGNRYRADMRSMPVRWPDMRRMADFAQARWDRFAPRVRGTDLRFRIEEAINGLKIAAHQYDMRLARRSERLERAAVAQAWSGFEPRQRLSMALASTAPRTRPGVREKRGAGAA